MALTGPDPLPRNPLKMLAVDLDAERRAHISTWPPGDNGLDPRRTHRVATDPLGLLLEAYERHGPIFSLRLLTSRNVFMIGPEANHFILVSGFENFRWRDGGLGQLTPLLGDGLLTTDGDFHRGSRRILLPAFHRERIAAAAGVMQEEAERALEAFEDGETVDVYRWARRLALRIAMRALFGLDPDRRRADVDAAREFERALGFYGRDFAIQTLRGPFTPWAGLQAARKRLDRLLYAEIARRRESGERGEDILSLLLDSSLPDRLVRDQVMTLLFAGHDTTTATISFLVYELARNPEERARLREDLDGRLDIAIDETLRLYPPAWIGPRRSTRAFEFAGYTVPAGVPVNYSSWVSHRLADVFPDPHAFRPQRMAPEAKAALPKGAYVPFGGGSRICIGMRFGLLEVRTVAATLLRAGTLDLAPGFELEIRQTPTLGPRRGLPMVFSRSAARRAPAPAPR